jgi:hypothetical protein
MSRRELLMRACEDSDYQALRELGWLQIYEALRDWWARKFPPHELKPYCDLLGQEEPGAVMVSVRNCIDYEWRPTPSGLYRSFSHARAIDSEKREATKDRLGRKKRQDQSPETLARVRWLLSEGRDKVCECVPRPNEVRIDGFHVTRCAMCGGIEQGQVFESEDEVSF